MQPIALGLAAAALLASGAAIAGPPSSLPWPSGAKTNLACLAAGRGTPVDVQHSHMGKDGATWADQAQAARGWVATAIRSGPPVALVSPWLLTTGSKGQFAPCAAGAFDSYWQRIGAAFAAAAAATSPAKPTGTRVIVEPGWEANIGSGSHPWGVDDVAQVPAYKACFQHVTGVLRAAFPGVTIAWTSAHRYFRNFTVAQMDPGVEDVYGLMYYDNTYNRTGAKLPITQATWDKALDAANADGPTGIGAWLAYARAHGKKLGVSEWGPWSGVNGLTFSQADDPTYILNMYAFFKANAAAISHDALQNNVDSATVRHALCPNTVFPRAWAEYQAIWH